MNFWLIINATTQYTYTQKKEKGIIHKVFSRVHIQTYVGVSKRGSIWQNLLSMWSKITTYFLSN